MKPEDTKKAFIYWQRGLNFHQNSQISKQRAHTGRSPMFPGSVGNLQSEVKSNQTPDYTTKERPYVWRECGRGFSRKSCIIRNQTTDIKITMCVRNVGEASIRSNISGGRRDTAAVKCVPCSSQPRTNCKWHRSPDTKVQTQETNPTCAEICGPGFHRKSHLGLPQAIVMEF